MTGSEIYLKIQKNATKTNVYATSGKLFKHRNLISEDVAVEVVEGKKIDE